MELGQAQDEEPDDDGETVPERGELFGTETMAELCVRQGRIGSARAIYQQLLQQLLAAGASDDQRRERWILRLQALDQAPRTGGARVHGDASEAGTGTLPAPRSPAVPAARPSDPLAERKPRPAAATSRSAPNLGPSSGALGRRPHRLPVVVQEPVRAGQIVYAERSDLIVLAPVNPGGQLIADGNIHVYARLRGRAVAGAHGATQARIYCQRLEAELVGIDSAYVTAEDLPRDRFGQPAQIFWDAGCCRIMPL